MILTHLNPFLVVTHDTSDWWWNSMAGNFQTVILNFCGPFPLPTQLQDWKTSFRDTFRVPDFSLPKPTPKTPPKNRMKPQVHKLTWFSSFFEGLAIMMSMWAAGRPKKTTNCSSSMLIFFGGIVGHPMKNNSGKSRLAMNKPANRQQALRRMSFRMSLFNGSKYHPPTKGQLKWWVHPLVFCAPFKGDLNLATPGNSENPSPSCTTSPPNSKVASENERVGRLSDETW